MAVGRHVGERSGLGANLDRIPPTPHHRESVERARIALFNPPYSMRVGGTAAFFDQNSGYEGQDAEGKNVTFTTQLMDGAKGIPAVLVAQYIIDSFSKGFHAPWFNMKDLLITAGSKAITRPLVGFVY